MADWTAFLEGGNEAVRQVTAWNMNPHLRDVWLASEYTRLKETPEIFAAAIGSGMPYGQMRRLDIELQGERAQKVGQILDDAGIDRSMMNPATASIAEARGLANKKREQIKLKKQEEESTGIWGAVTDAADWVWGGVKDTLSTVGSALEGAWQGAIAGPMAAGQAQSDADKSWVERNVPVLGDYFGGWANILGASEISDAQKEDMRKAGFDPDAWNDRYGWYFDMHDQHQAVNDTVVNEAKNQFNPAKVDLGRELLTLGVVDDPTRISAASEDAQLLFDRIRHNQDAEGTAIIEKLANQRFGPGAELANLLQSGLDTVGIETDRDHGWYKAAEIVGDLAVGWTLAPEILAAKGFKSFRNSRWMVENSAESVKDAIINSKVVGGRWDNFLDKVDEIHVLEDAARQSGKAEDLVEANKAFRRFSSKYAELMPFYDTVLGMRRGTITGTFINTNALKRAPKDVGDARANLIGITRVDDVAKPGAPVWSLRSKPGEKVSDDAKRAARVAVADQIGDAVLAHQVTRGLPISKPGKVLLPGQIRVSEPVRFGMAKFTDALSGTDRRLLKQLKEAEGSIVDMNKLVDVDASTLGVLGSQGGQWLKDNYLKGGLRSRMARSFSKFGLIRDAAVLKFDGMESTKTFHEFARGFLPKGQAAFLANQWAKADPAARSVMAHNLFLTLDDAIGGQTMAARKFWDNQVKEFPLPVSKGGSQRVAYSSPEKDLIKVGNDQMAAGMYSTQFADGMQLPSYLEVMRNSKKAGLLGHIAGVSNTPLVSRLSRVGKVGWIATPSNFMRQLLEVKSTQFLEDPRGAVRAGLAHAGLAGDTAAQRVALNKAVRQAKELQKKGGSELLRLHQQKKFDEYAARAGELVKGELDPTLAAILREGAPVADVAKGRSSLRLASTRFAVDPVRQLRAKMYAKASSHEEVSSAYDWMEKVDEQAGLKLADAAFQQIGHQRSQYVNGAVEDMMEQLEDATKYGLRVSAIKLGNQHEYLGPVGDQGALNWLNTLGQRLSDPVGGKVASLMAKTKLNEKGALDNAKAQLAAAHPQRLEEIAEIQNVSDYAKFVLKNDQSGEAYRLSGRRAQYDASGKFIRNPEDRSQRLEQWADDMVDDLDTYLGLKKSGARGKEALLARIAAGEPVEARDLMRVSEDLRPDQVYAPIIVPRSALSGTGTPTEKIAGLASKYYNFVVAGPLRRMGSNPQAIAAHREVMTELEPYARELAERGLSHQTIYDYLQQMAWGHAISRTVRYTDNPEVTSYFAALSNNFFWFERAMEDFARRAMTIAKADPAVFGRAWLMTEAALHSGVIYKQTGTDDEGNQESEYVFTFPGSGLMQRAWSEGLASMGITDDPLAPVWGSLTAPVKYLSPTLQNPVGFTTSPMIGIPLRWSRSLFPSQAPDIDKTIAMFEGGDRMFASSGWAQTLLPVPIRRIYNVLSDDEQSSQLMSAMGNAMIYHQAAGLMPGPEATDLERQKYMDSLRSTTQGTLAFRALFATFTPATPTSYGSNVGSIGDDEVNIFDRLRGVNTIRGEYFNLLEEMNKKYKDSNRAFSEAQAEWLKRGHASIVHPEAFAVGSTKAPVKGGKSFASNMDLTQWMLDNKQFLDEFGLVGYALLPAVEGGKYYDNIGYRIQLRDGLRERKSVDEMYESLVVAQGWRDYAKAQQAAEKTGDLAGFRAYQGELATANPIWAASRSQYKSFAFVDGSVAPYVRRLAEAAVLPSEVMGVQKEVGLLADLYDSYSAARAQATHRNARIELAKLYGAKGDSLFKNGPISDLWSAMKVWED